MFFRSFFFLFWNVMFDREQEIEKEKRNSEEFETFLKFLWVQPEISIFANKFFSKWNFWGKNRFSEFVREKLQGWCKMLIFPCLSKNCCYLIFLSLNMIWCDDELLNITFFCYILNIRREKRGIHFKTSLIDWY